MDYFRIYQYTLYSLLVILPFGLTGCQTYSFKKTVPPEAAVPEQYTDRSEDVPLNEMSQPWWLEFDRPTLNQLIQQALKNNLDVRQAMARLRQAEAIAIQTRSEGLPNVDLGGNARKDWEGSDPLRGEAEIGGAFQWEVDAFNRIGAATRADSLEIEARREDVAALRLTLSAEVANVYFDATAVVQRLELLNQQLSNDNELLELLELRFEHGVGTKVDVLQQQSRVADSESLILPAEAALRVFENRLDVLLGETPDANSRVLPTETFTFADELPALGVPADLLLHRPDLRAAQAELKAADADIAAAIADRMPRIMLDGSVMLKDQSSYTGPFSMIMASFVQPLLDWGRRKAEVERNRAVYDERLARFTQLFLRAVEEVENALYQENRQRETVIRLDKQRQILQETVNETEARYLQGIDNYLPVLNALQELREIERTLINQRLNLVRFRIALHRAVGGPLNFLQSGNSS